MRHRVLTLIARLAWFLLKWIVGDYRDTKYETPDSRNVPPVPGAARGDVDGVPCQSPTPAIPVEIRPATGEGPLPAATPNGGAPRKPGRSRP